MLNRAAVRRQIFFHRPGRFAKELNLPGFRLGLEKVLYMAHLRASVHQSILRIFSRAGILLLLLPAVVIFVLLAASYFVPNIFHRGRNGCYRLRIDADRSDVVLDFAFTDDPHSTCMVSSTHEMRFLGNRLFPEATYWCNYLRHFTPYENISESSLAGLKWKTDSWWSGTGRWIEETLVLPTLYLWMMGIGSVLGVIFFRRRDGRGRGFSIITGKKKGISDKWIRR